MPTTKTKTQTQQAKKSALDYYVYVPLGAGQLLLEKTKQFSGLATTFAKTRPSWKFGWTTPIVRSSRWYTTNSRMRRPLQIIVRDAVVETTGR